MGHGIALNTVANVPRFPVVRSSPGNTLPMKWCLEQEKLDWETLFDVSVFRTSGRLSRMKTVICKTCRGLNKLWNSCILDNFTDVLIEKLGANRVCWLEFPPLVHLS